RCRKTSFPASTPRRQAEARSAVVGDALHRTLRSTHRGTGQRLDLLLRSEGVGDPLLVEVEGALRHALGAFVRVDLAGVAAVQQLEEVVLGLAVGTGVP